MKNPKGRRSQPYYRHRRRRPWCNPWTVCGCITQRSSLHQGEVSWPCRRSLCTLAELSHIQLIRNRSEWIPATYDWVNSSAGTSAHIYSLLSMKCRLGDGYFMANVDPSLHVLCLAVVWAGMVIAPKEVIGIGTPHGWSFGGEGGTLGA